MIPIKQALGRQIKCPDNGCDRPVLVAHAKGRVSDAAQSDPIRTAPLWYRVDCPKSGAKLYRAETPVEVIP